MLLSLPMKNHEEPLVFLVASLQRQDYLAKYQTLTDIRYKSESFSYFKVYADNKKKETLFN